MCSQNRVHGIQRRRHHCFLQKHLLKFVSSFIMNSEDKKSQTIQQSQDQTPLTVENVPNDQKTSPSGSQKLQIQASSMTPNEPPPPYHE
ncbi:hypothetical protein G9A89_001816 [Geosiphon pyriformis]|nr:hypothetical protein G9A89_001816 [Geosiphon pyriformis]